MNLAPIFGGIIFLQGRRCSFITFRAKFEKPGLRLQCQICLSSTACFLRCTRCTILILPAPFLMTRKLAEGTAHVLSCLRFLFVLFPFTFTFTFTFTFVRHCSNIHRRILLGHIYIPLATFHSRFYFNIFFRGSPHVARVAEDI